MRFALFYLLLLLLALFSLFGVWLLEPTYQPQHALLSHCTGSVAFEGVVVEVMQRHNLALLTLRDTSFFPIVVFDEVTIQEGQRILVTGSFQEYNNKPQIIADEIKLFQ